MGEKQRQNESGTCQDHVGQWQGQHPGLTTSQPVLVPLQQPPSNPLPITPRKI